MKQWRASRYGQPGVRALRGCEITALPQAGEWPFAWPAEADLWTRNAEL